MAGLLVLALITTFQPPRPAVGDLITINFAAQVSVDPSPDYEVVSRAGNSVVIRTFVPHTIEVKGQSADGAVSVLIPVQSVLKPDDNLEPAPLKPPKPEPWPRLPFLAIAIAALAASAAWTAVVLLAKRRVSRPRIVVVPAEQFRSSVVALRSDPNTPMRWARLADALRAYLAAARADLGSDLTTSELLRVIERKEAEEERRYVAAILRQGDLEKFSPWGAAPAGFDEIASYALEIPSWVEPPAVDQEAAA